MLQQSNYLILCFSNIEHMDTALLVGCSGKRRSGLGGRRQVAVIELAGYTVNDGCALGRVAGDEATVGVLPDDEAAVELGWAHVDVYSGEVGVCGE